MRRLPAGGLLTEEPHGPRPQDMNPALRLRFLPFFTGVRGEPRPRHKASLVPLFGQSRKGYSRNSAGAAF